MADDGLTLNKNESYILYLLGRHERLTVDKLCALLDAAPSTMRRILTHMEEKGLIIRTHGGAVSIDSRQDEPLERKVTLNISQKKAIALAARDLVSDGDCIAIGDGSTTAELCHRLKNARDLTVYTDSITAANILMHDPGVELRVCSGIVQGKTGHIVGLEAEQFFAGIQVDKAFVGADTVSVQEGIGSSNILASTVERNILRCARQKVVLCDCSKINKALVAKMVPLETIDCLVTDHMVARDFVQEAEKLGVRVIIAPSGR